MKEDNYIKLLRNIGLSRNQALVYFTLIKAGTKGTIVRELNHALAINRTNIYPILSDLIKMGCVKEGGHAEKSKNAKIYVAIEPIKFIDDIIKKKREEINELLENREKLSEPLQNIFQEGIEVHLDEINPNLRIYLEPLVKAGWKINSYIERKDLPMFDYEVYDTMLHTPHISFLKDCSFHLFIFGYDIQEDKNALEFFSQSLKRKTKEMKSYFFDIKQFQLIDDKVEFFRKEYSCFKMRIKKKDFVNSKYFSEIPEVLKGNINTKQEEYLEIGKAVIIPVKRKLFYLWAESDEIIREMIEPIKEIENL